MRTLFNMWLARWQAAFVVRTMELISRLLGGLLSPIAGGGRSLPAYPATTHREHHHGVEEHAEPGIWFVAPRVTLVIWLAAGAVALAHHVHRPRFFGPPTVRDVEQWPPPSAASTAMLAPRSTATGLHEDIAGR